MKRPNDTQVTIVLSVRPHFCTKEDLVKAACEALVEACESEGIEAPSFAKKYTDQQED